MIKGIKKALNTTIGTKNFQPLDEIIDNATRLVPSIENRIYLFGDGKVSVGYPDVWSATRIATCTGGCYFGFGVRYLGDGDVLTRIYINDHLICYNFYSMSDPDSDEKVYYPFWFKKGDKIKIELMPSAQKNLNSIGFYAMPTKRNVLVEVLG